MTAGPSAAMQASVLVLNRLYMAVQVMSVRRAFCLLCKDLAEVVNVENGTYVSYNFQSCAKLSEWKAAVSGRQGRRLDSRRQFRDSGAPRHQAAEIRPVPAERGEVQSAEHFSARQ